MRVLMAVALLVTSLAGCSEAPTDEQVFEEAVEQGIAADLPPWEVGMWWEYETTGGVSKFIVTGETGNDYIVDTNDQQVAYFDAMFDISFLGEIRKSDLAASQGDERIVMFDWPLTENKEWQTSWDGLTYNMVANAMGENQFHVTGTVAGSGNLAVEYHYNADVAWFEYIIFYNSTTEEEQFRLNLLDSGFDYKGSIYRYTIGETIGFFGGATESGLQDVRFGSEWNELYFRALIVCNGDPAGMNFIGVSTPSHREQNPIPMSPFLNEPTWGDQIDCGQESYTDRNTTMANEEGDWQLGMAGSSPNVGFHLWVEPRFVEIIQL